MLKIIIERVVSVVLVVSLLFITACDKPEPVPVIYNNPDNDKRVNIFYLDEMYQPSKNDTAKITAMIVEDTETLVTSEETEQGDYIVRFASLSEEKSTSFALYFGRENFPNSIITEHDGNTASLEISPYNFTEENFILIDNYTGYEINTYTLNKEIFKAYSPSKDLTQSQNTRMRNMIMGIAMASVIELQEKEIAEVNGAYKIHNDYGQDYYMILTKGAGDTIRKVAITVAVAVVAVVVFTCPVSLIAAPVGIGIGISAAVSAGTAAIVGGILFVDTIIYNNADAIAKLFNNLPNEEPDRTGKKGPGGGMIIDGRCFGEEYDFEIIPVSSDTGYTYSGALSYVNSISNNTGWRLPTYEELYIIYSQFLINYKFALERMLSPIDSNFLWTGTLLDGNTHAYALDLSVKDEENFENNFSINSVNNQYSVTLIRELNNLERFYENIIVYEETGNECLTLSSNGKTCQFLIDIFGGGGGGQGACTWGTFNYTNPGAGGGSGGAIRVGFTVPASDSHVVIDTYVGNGGAGGGFRQTSNNDSESAGKTGANGGESWVEFADVRVTAGGGEGGGKPGGRNGGTGGSITVNNPDFLFSHYEPFSGKRGSNPKGYIGYGGSAISIGGYSAGAGGNGANSKNGKAGDNGMIVIRYLTLD